MKMSLSAFVLPFLFVFRPALLMSGSPLEILNVAGTAMAGLILFSFFAERYLLTKTTWLQQFFLLTASILLILPLPLLYTIAGGLCGIFVIFWQQRQGKGDKIAGNRA